MGTVLEADETQRTNITSNISLFTMIDKHDYIEWDQPLIIQMAIPERMRLVGKHVSRQETAEHRGEHANTI